jgi:hypothetical protein
MVSARQGIPAGVVTILAMATAVADSGLPAVQRGKPGLYEFAASTNGSIFRAKGAGDLPEKELQRQANELLARSIPVFRFCVSKQGSELFDPKGILGPACTYSNVVTAKSGYSADARCVVDQRTDLVHLVVETDTPEHQRVTHSMSLPGTSLSMINRYEIRWISSDCGDIPPGARRTPEGKLIVPPNP